MGAAHESTHALVAAPVYRHPLLHFDDWLKSFKASENEHAQHWTAATGADVGGRYGGGQSFNNGGSFRRGSGY